MPTPRRLSLPFYAANCVQYVAAPPIGDPANDGMDPRYPKGSWYQAYEALPAGGGTIYIQSGSYWGKPTATAHVTPLAKQGCRLTNFTDVNGNYWPGFAPFKPVVTIGVAAAGAPFGPAIAAVLPGDPGDGAFPQPPEYDYGVWIAANTAGPFAFYNINPGLTHGGWMIGINGNPGQDPYDPANRMAQTTLFHFENCSTFDSTVDDPQAQWNIGYSFFGDFKNITANCTTIAAITSERRAGMLVKGGTGSPDFLLDGYNGGQGGIIYIPGSSTWRFDIRNARVEGDFVNPLPPVVWGKALHGAGTGFVSGLDQADSGGVSLKTLKIEHSGGFFPGQVVANGLDPSQVDGSCDMRGGQASFDATISVWPPRDNQIGFIRNTLWGNSYGPPFNIAIAANPRRNLNPQHTDPGGQTGPLTPVPQNPTSNCVYTASNATGAHGVAAPIADRWGGNTGFRLATNNGSNAQCDLFSANRAVAAGDSFYLSFWAKIATGAGAGVVPAIWSCTGGVVTGVVYYGTDGNGDFTVPFTGESGTWQQYIGVLNILSVSGAGNGAFRIQLQAAPNHAVDFCGVRIENILASDGLMEATSLMQFGGPTWQGAVGSISTPPGALLVAGSLGVDNSVAAATPGTIVKKIQVFDREGNSLGYVPVYNAIT